MIFVSDHHIKLYYTSSFNRRLRSTINKSLQLKIAKQGTLSRKLHLSVNKNLLPEAFSLLFLDCSTCIARQYRLHNFKYNNPKTQELLEKYLILL